MKRNQTYLVIGIVVAAFFLLGNTAGAAVSTNMISTITSNYIAQYGQNAGSLFAAAINSLVNVIPTQMGLKLALSQVLFETGNFSSSSDLAIEYNNFSGIEWINQPSLQLNAYKGPAFPGSSTVFYAGFDSPQDWANDFYRILSDVDGITFNETSIQEYAQALKDGGYFTSAESSYAAGMQRYFDILTSVGM